MQKTPQKRLFLCARIWDTWLWKDLDKPLKFAKKKISLVKPKNRPSKAKNRRCYKKSKVLRIRLIQFQTSRTKIGRVTLIRNTEIVSRQISKRGSTSAPHNSALKTPYPPLPYIIWTAWTWGFTTYHKAYTIPIKKLRKLQFSDRFLGYFWWFLRFYIRLGVW